MQNHGGEMVLGGSIIEMPLRLLRRKRRVIALADRTRCGPMGACCPALYDVSLSLRIVAISSPAIQGVVALTRSMLLAMMTGRRKIRVVDSRWETAFRF